MEDYLVDQLLETNEVHKEKATSRELIYLVDQNGSSYQGDIQFDLSSWSNNGKYIDYSNSYITIPYLVDVTMTGPAVAAVGSVPAIPADTFAPDVNPYCITLKNGFYQIIDSIQITVNGTTVVEQHSYINMHTNFRVLTQWSQDDLKKWGPSLGVYPDDSGSTRFSNVANASGDGYSNNRGDSILINATAADFKINRDANVGLEKRAELTTAYDPLNQGGVPTAATATGAYGMNTWEKTPVVNPTRVTWMVVASIRLKDICPFFENCGLLRNVSVRANIVYNSGISVVTVTNPGAPVMALTSYTKTSGYTNPIIVNSLATGANSIANGASMNREGVYTITTAVGVVNGKRHPTMPNCRWYAAAYTLAPSVEKMIQEVVPVRNIRYDDLYSFLIPNVAPGPFNTIISNGISRLKYVLVLPFANTAAGVFATAHNTPTYQSPFDTAGSTTCPLANITNWQVQLGGSNIFQTSIEYTFNEFLFELASINAVNAGALTGMTSGLLSSHDFNFNYRFYVADLSRNSQVNNIPQSLAILGTNTSGVTLNLHVFAIYEKEVRIDSMSGQIVA